MRSSRADCGRLRDARSKIQPAGALTQFVRRAQSFGRRVVFTNGCFDLLHPGHIKVLQRARMLGDLLVVGINSDRSVRRLKGRGRPINRQQDRAAVLAGLESVDYVTIFDAPTPQRLIVQLRPNILVKGADWGAGKIVGGDTVERHGGRVVRIPLAAGHSTSAIIARILTAHGSPHRSSSY